MTDRVVVDASVVVAALLRDDDVGVRCAELMATDAVVAPALMPFEAASGIRGQERGALVSPDLAADALRLVAGLPFESWAFALLADRVWELRAAVSAYDAAYVALAELTELPLATLDLRLTRSPGPRCEFLVPA